MRGGAGEQVVQQIERQQQDDGRNARRNTAHQRAAFFTQPGDEASGGETVSQRDQRGEPDKGIPCRFVVSDIAPGQHAGPQHQHDNQQGSQRRFNPVGGEDPHHQREANKHQQQDFIARQFAQFFQFTSGPQRHFVIDFYFWRVEPVRQQRHGQDQQDTERQEGDKPGTPGDVDTDDAFYQRQRQQVRRQRRQEHGTGDTGGGNSYPHQIRTNTACARIVRFRTVQRRQVSNNRVDGPAATCGVGRGKRRQQQVSEGNGVAQRQAAAAKIFYQNQRQTAAELGFVITRGEHERAEDEPHGRVAKAAHRPFK